jgi:hypothetical protein
MDRKTIIVSAIISAVVAAAVAFSVFVFFFFPRTAFVMDPAYKSVEKTPTPRPTPDAIPREEVNEADVSAVSINTVYKNFYAEGSKCRQTYNEYFKNTDGVGSSSSPCRVTLTFDRDGRAEKTIEVRRYDTGAKEWRLVERNVWKGKIADAQFADLTKLIVNNQAFQNWNDNMLINVSNCTVSVRYAGGTKSPMSNVDDRATAYLPMVKAFQELDAKTVWEKVN